jgi:hypothetical protein
MTVRTTQDLETAQIDVPVMPFETQDTERSSEQEPKENDYAKHAPKCVRRGCYNCMTKSVKLT